MSTTQGAALDTFRAMQGSSPTMLSKGSSVGVVEGGDGGGEGGEGAEKTVPSEFLTAEVWCRTITTLAQVRYSAADNAKWRLPYPMPVLCVASFGTRWPMWGGRGAGYIARPRDDHSFDHGFSGVGRLVLSM